ncbi:hypothetical protein KSP39_PZI007123 [Platanthera zijinensis]|uniref:S1-like domain-containing protein n=1 Tax=Platanthera zijinensis TaxID=2320716 RepID=A0AAP0G9T6_9ASPA
MHKKVWIAAGDIVLVGLREYQDDKAGVILKYMPDEARLFKAYGELLESTCLNEGIAGGLDEEDDGTEDDCNEFLSWVCRAVLCGCARVFPSSTWIFGEGASTCPPPRFGGADH